ncbi:unnamed protein product, partial [Ectocarpus sp. 12 AP-2014]
MRVDVPAITLPVPEKETREKMRSLGREMCLARTKYGLVSCAPRDRPRRSTCSWTLGPRSRPR